MLWITLCVGFFGGIIALLFCVVGFFIEIKSCWRDWGTVRVVGIATLIFVAMFIGSLFGLDAVFQKSYEETIQTAEYKLVSIKDNSQLEGSGSGGLFYVYVSMDTNEVYTYYYKLEDGGYKKGKISSENAVIYEKDDCKPLITEYTTYTKVNMNHSLENFLTFGSFNKSEKSYKIFVPKGTIAQDYYLDAE